MATQKILLETIDGIRLIKLNDPDSLNPLTVEMSKEFLAAITQIEHEPNVRGVIITGCGRAFSAGGDIKAMQERTRTPAYRVRETGRQFYENFLSIRKVAIPTIAAVNGHAVGAGAGLALACDLRLCADGAKFGFPFVKLGLYPGMGATYFLPRFVGAARAFELLTTCDLIPAAEAERIGLVNRVVPAAQLLPEALRLAQKIASMPPGVIKMVKEAIYLHPATDLDAAIERESSNQALTFTTEDIKEGIAAVLEKRPPQFRNKV
ncbi:MAG: enoyl-CoA hydratase/isomerase family protein [Deltaproteobacteria bacterium]|nr:enoyl-CoA hydratase/isomerase family protein [Deltaproteobacteria bacterium]